MAIRLRRINTRLVALCANESDLVLGDKYIDDEEHHALATKFAIDWKNGFEDKTLAMLAESQKKRDAREEIEKVLVDNITLDYFLRKGDEYNKVVLYLRDHFWSNGHLKWEERMQGAYTAIKLTGPKDFLLRIDNEIKKLLPSVYQR
jgi:hypothetical protein